MRRWGKNQEARSHQRNVILEAIQKCENGDYKAFYFLKDLSTYPGSKWASYARKFAEWREKYEEQQHGVQE